MFLRNGNISWEDIPPLPTNISNDKWQIRVQWDIHNFMAFKLIEMQGFRLSERSKFRKEASK